MSRKSELIFAEFFVNWFNRAKGKNYKVLANEKQSSEVDVFAISDSEPTLNLQVTTPHGEIMQRAVMNTKRHKRGLDLIVGDVKFEKWIPDVLQKKDNKYPQNIKKDLIILLAGHIPTPSPGFIIKNFSHCACYPFKGIYYVSTPAFSSAHENYVENGFVVAIKDI